MGQIEGVEAGQFTGVDGLSIEQEVIEYNPGDDVLNDYSINFALDNLTAGKEPEYKIETKYNYTGNVSYYGEVNYSVRTFSNDTVNITYVYLRVDTYEKTLDARGNVTKKLLFTDVFKVKYATINVDSRSGSSTVREVLEMVIDHAEYG